MERISYLEKITKDYFIESDDFLFTKKYINNKSRMLNLVFRAYNLEYNLVLKDYKIFFDNKLKTKYSENTTLCRKNTSTKHIITKYFLASKKLKSFKFVASNFDYGNIVIKPNIVATFKVKRKKKDLTLKKLKSKLLTKKFFFQNLLRLN